MCSSVYQGSTEGFTPDSINIDFPCGSIDNSQWLSFFPNPDGFISITALVSNCLNSQGIQSLLYDSDFNPVSDCFSSNGSNATPTFSVSGLNPLKPYHLIIDGVAGDICEILIISP